MVAAVLLGCLLLSVLVQIVYAILLFNQLRLRPFNNPVEFMALRPVSIVICARNEAHNLAQHLPLILAQRYNNAPANAAFEVIVVDDASTDNTADILAGLPVRVVTLPPPAATDRYSGKKRAIMAGVAAAQYPWLAFIDADCYPASDYWLMTLMGPLSMEKELVAGVGLYDRMPGLLNAFIRWETMHTFLQYASYALAGQPYMAVGRNMACTRTAFDKAAQSPIWQQLPYGDDDMLVTIAGNATNVAVVTTPQSFTFSAPATSWKDWFSRKQRHMSTGKYYRAWPKILLSLYGIAHALCWLLFFIMVFTPFAGYAVMLMLLRCVCIYYCWSLAAVQLNEKNLRSRFLLFDILWMVYNFALAPYIIWKNKQHWK